MQYPKSKTRFNQYVDNFLKQNKLDFYVIRTNASHIAIWDEEKRFGATYRKLATPGDQKVLWIYSVVKSSFKKYLLKNTYEKFARYPSEAKNRININKLKVGDHFYGTDASHCYWRMSYNLNYISYKLYAKLLDEKLKTNRNKAMACLSSVKKKDYYIKGKFNRTEIINEPRLRDLYNNVRYKSFELMDDCRVMCGNGFIKYKVDCIYYLQEKKQAVESYFEHNEMPYKTSHCIYLGNGQFIEGSEIKTL